MKKIKKGDDLILLSGKDKGRTGQVLNVLKNSKEKTRIAFSLY